MTTFYEILKEKANNPEYKNKIVYVELPETLTNENYQKLLGFTYSNFLSLVNKYIEEIKKARIRPNNSKAKYVVVKNNLASTAAIIALLECDFTPILIDLNTTPVFATYEIPFIYTVTFTKLEYFVSKVLNNFSNDAIRNSNIKLTNQHEIIICSSGSEGTSPHFNVITEKSLIESKKQYGKKNATFYSYISSANISGLLTNLVNPLINDTKVVIQPNFDLTIFNKNIPSKSEEKVKLAYLFSRRNVVLQDCLFFEDNSSSKFSLNGNRLEKTITIKNGYKEKFHKNYKQLRLKCGTLEEFNIKIDSIMLPRNILNYVNKLNILELSYLENIYLAGGVNSKNVIDEIRKKTTIKENAFVNLYGATEAGGVICTCNEKDLTPCFIDITNYQNGEIIYTFDKINFFRIKEKEHKKIKYAFNEFNFVSYIPVGKTENVLIDNNYVIHFKNSEGEFINSSDIGVFIQDKLYVLGRKKSLININNKTYFINSIEAYFTNKFGLDTYCTKDENSDIFHLFIDAGKTKLLEKLIIYKYILEISQKFKEFKLDLPVIIETNAFPRSKISGKISRPKLKNFEKYSTTQYDNVFNYKESKQKYLNNIIDNCLSEYDVEILDDYKFKVKCKKVYFFPLFLTTGGIIKLVSFDDELGEIIFQLTDEFIFDTSRTKIILMNDSFHTQGYQAEFMKNLLLHGVDEKLKKELNKFTDFKEAYKEIDYNKSISEILYQMKINILAEFLSMFDRDYANIILNGVEEKTKELLFLNKEKNRKSIF